MSDKFKKYDIGKHPCPLCKTWMSCDSVIVSGVEWFQIVCNNTKCPLHVTQESNDLEDLKLRIGLNNE